MATSAASAAAQLEQNLRDLRGASGTLQFRSLTRAGAVLTMILQDGTSRTITVT
jgi:hypothetical protein